MSTDQEALAIPLRRERVDVGLLLELTTEVMQRQARAQGVTLTITIADDVPDTILLDRDKVGWVITSLVGSALRHARTPGSIIDVRAQYNPAESTFSISVRDNGPGIPRDILDKLLTRGSWRPGAALALLLVEDIAVAHHGRVDVESRTGPDDHFTTIRFAIRAPTTQTS
jgi:signal transduction histidine kinase